MRPRLAPSRRLAAMFVLALGAALAGALFTESARVALRTPLVPREVRSAPVSVPLEGREARRGSVLFRLELAAPDPAALLAHEELQLFFESPAPRALVGARLELRGAGCMLDAAARAELTSREPVAFRRSPACTGPQVASGPAVLDLVAEVRGEGGLGLLGFELPAGVEATPLQVAPTRQRPAALAVRGAFVDYPEQAPRIVLLNHMWRVAPGTGWLVGLVGLAVALALAGCVVFPVRPIVPPLSPASATGIARAAAGASLLAASLALLHAVIDPPLSGPDEPYHLLGFAALAGDEAMARDTVAWMGETHLWRIRQQPGERFRTIDVSRPYVVPDDQLRPTEVTMRSAIVARLWRAVAPLVRGSPAPRALLTLRFVNVMLFAVAVGAAAALAGALVSEPFPQWLVFPFLFVPALPFFAMHVSETAILCSVYVLLAASLAVLSLDGPRAHWAGPALGLATGLMLAGGRSPWPLVALVGAVVLGRVALGSRGALAPGRAALVFWGGLGLGAMVFLATMDEPYRLMTEMYAVHPAHRVPAALREMGVWLLTHWTALVVLVAAGAALGAAFEVALARLRERCASRFGHIARRLVAQAAAALAVAVVLSLLGSLFVSYPQLPAEATYTMQAHERVVAVLKTMTTMFRLTDPNFLLASSFWVGFGWLDTMPGPAFQGLLMALVGIALVALLRYIGRRGQVRRFLWLATVAAGATAALVVYTASTQDRVSTLVGRHLIGWYLSVLTVIGGALTLDHRAQPDVSAPAQRRGSGRAVLLLVVTGLVHVYCLSFVLRRYF